MNFLSATVERVEDNVAQISFEGLQGGTVPIQVEEGSVAEGQKVEMGVRPEHLSAGGEGTFGLSGIVEFIEQLGGASYAYAPSFGAGSIIASADVTRRDLAVMKELKMTFSAEHCMLFDAAGLRISKVGT